MALTINGTGIIVGSDRAASGANTDITALGGLTTLGSFRNRIINGNMRVAQRASAAITGGYNYSACDRTIVLYGGYTSPSGTVSQLSLAGSTSGLWQSTTFTATGSGIIYFLQRIEAANISDLNGKTITISAMVYQSSGAAQTCQVRLDKPTVVDNWTGENVITTSSAITIPNATPTKVTFTYTLGATDCTNGLSAWVQWSTNAVTGAVFAISDFQLELGSVATPFEIRPYGLELALCQRYYETGVLRNITAGVTYLGGTYSFHVQKRAGVSLVYTDIVGNVNRFSINGSNNLTFSAGGVGIDVNAITVDAIPTTSMPGNTWWQISFTASAEL